MLIKIDKSKCVGCGACAALAPKCFELGDDRKAKVKSPCAYDADCKTAIENCPVNAILLKQ